MKKIGIVGGGASGMAAAIAAARMGADVTIMEGNERLGKKILATGNGKCNLGNLVLSANEYYGGSREFIQRALDRFGTEDTVDFFRSMGLMIKERNGYLYPASEQAAVVLDVLRFELQRLGVKVITECRIGEVGREKKTGKVIVSDGKERYFFDAVILACGSKAAPKTGSDGSGYRLAGQLGHSLISTVPALVQLKCKEDYLKAVAGVRAESVITICTANGFQNEKIVAKERGELQLTEYGISGIPVFQLSRAVNYILKEQKALQARIDFLPDYDEKAMKELEEERKKLIDRNKTVEEFFAGMLNKKLMALFIKLAGLKGNIPVSQAEKDKLHKVYQLCKDWSVHVTGSNSYENAQVCAGGVSLAEVTDNMESVKAPGVYIVGELLDVDGRCGGYNLQWAWTSGCLAGRAAASDSQKGKFV